MVEVKEAFLPLIGLYAPQVPMVYIMRFLKEVPISSELDLEARQHEMKVLDHHFAIPRIDAIFLKRPYIRIVDGDPSLVKGKARFLMGGGTIAEGRFSDFVINETELPETFPWIYKPESYSASKCDDRHLKEVPTTPKIGLMAVDTDILQVFVEVDRPLTGKVRIEAGVLAGMYTTKNEPYMGV